MNPISKIYFYVFLAVTIVSSYLFTPETAYAAPKKQDDDPASSCAKGIDYSSDGNNVKALPLLEFGFFNWDDLSATKLNEYGICGLELGYIYKLNGNFEDAININLAALDAFRTNGNNYYEGLLLNEIGLLYKILGEYSAATDFFQDALVISKKEGDKVGEGVILYNLGLVYFAQNKDDKALEYYFLSLDLTRNIGDLIGQNRALHNIGAIYLNHDKYHEALEYLNEALLISRETGAIHNEGETLSTIGLVYFYMGDYVQALEINQEALELRKTVGDLRGEGLTLRNIGEIFSYQGEYDEALVFHSQALEIFREIAYIQGEALSLSSIGEAHIGQGKYNQAILYLQEALELAEYIEDWWVIGGVIHNIGWTYYFQGKYSESLSAYYHSLEIRNNINDKIGLKATLNNIASVFSAQGRLDDAINYYSQALVIAEETENLVSIARINANIGSIYADQGNIEKAIIATKEALAVSEHINALELKGGALENLGTFYLAEKEYNKSLDYFHKALDIHRAIGARRSEGNALTDMGTLFFQQGEYEEAIRHYEQALLIHREVGNKEMEANTLEFIGFAYKTIGENSESLNYYQHALQIIEELRVISGSDIGRASFISKYKDIYDNLLSLYQLKGQFEKSFVISERGRGRSFLDSISTGHIELSDDESTELYFQERAAYADRQSTIEALAKAKAQNPQDSEQITDLEVQLSHVEQTYQDAIDAIIVRGDKLTQLIPGRSTVLDFQQAQELLDENTTLLSFWLLEHQTVVFILTQGTFETVSLPIERAELYTKIQSFRTFANITDQYPNNAVALYGELVEPLLPYINTINLMIVPHSELHYLPFAALTDGSQYLIDQFAISYIPSISALPFIKQNGGKVGGKPLIIGNPSTDLSQLPSAKAEAIFVANMLGTTPFLEQYATESTLRQKASNTSILHLAAHGYYNSINPLYSALYLAGDEQEDGMLEVHEIYNLNLAQTELVVLSACESQLGELSSGDELVGLTRAFFYAGAPSVIASLWEVDDISTQILMEKFYINWGEGMSLAEALKQAQIETRKDYPNPYYWAAFVLNGEGGNMQQSIVIRNNEDTSESNPSPHPEEEQSITIEPHASPMPEKGQHTIIEPLSSPKLEKDRPVLPVCGSSLALISALIFFAKKKDHKISPQKKNKT